MLTRVLALTVESSLCGLDDASSDKTFFVHGVDGHCNNLKVALKFRSYCGDGKLLCHENDNDILNNYLAVVLILHCMIIIESTDKSGPNHP